MSLDKPETCREWIDTLTRELAYLIRWKFLPLLTHRRDERDEWLEDLVHAPRRWAGLETWEEREEE